MKLHPTVKSLLAEIDAFRRASVVSKTTFGIRACKDGHLISRLERGHVPTLLTIDRIRKYMREHQRERA